MIELKNISKVYRIDSVRVEALKNINLRIEDGEFVAIMGPSGSGKSTLMNIIGCLDVPTSGEYYLDYVNVSEYSESRLADIRNKKIGFVFQSFNLLPRLNAFSNVELPLIYSGNTKNRKERVISALKAVNILDRANHRPSELSGGQQQKVAIARALVNEPSIILADEPTGNLDSKAGEEIMNILTGLNEKGITVVLVTHEDSIARYARRIVRLRDGEIVDDRRIKEEPGDRTVKNKEVKGRKQFLLSFGELVQSMKMAIFSIFANKLRSFLTMLGIIVGVAAVIIMLALGSGAQSQITSNISKMGVNLLMVRPGGQLRGPMRGIDASNIKMLTTDDAEAIKREVAEIDEVCPSVARGYEVVYGNKNTTTTVNAVTPNFILIRDFPVQYGEFISDEDERYLRRVVVLGKTVKDALFGDEDPIGQYVKINRQTFQVIGVMSEKGVVGFGGNIDDAVYIPLRTGQKRLFGIDYITTLFIKAKSQDVMDRAIAKITKLLRERHRLRDTDPNDFNITSQKDILETVQSTTKTFTLLLAGIAIVSLIVGGIGIMNIMFVSVTERTREIGIRKAIGGKQIDILSQFLIESIIVSLSGGLLGILVGVTLSKTAGNLIFQWQTLVTPKSILMSFGFAFAVGLFFGFYPALKASNLNPIEALRYE